jgi:hypothetical protein
MYARSICVCKGCANITAAPELRPSRSTVLKGTANFDVKPRYNLKEISSPVGNRLCGLVVRLPGCKMLDMTVIIMRYSNEML